MSQAPATCSLCARELPAPECGELHHLVPRSKKGRKTVVVCVDCGDQIHQLFTTKELERSYNSLEALRADDRVQRWIDWVRRRPSFGTCMKRKKRRT